MDIDPPEINLYVPKDETENENFYTDHWLNVYLNLILKIII